MRVDVEHIDQPESVQRQVEDLCGKAAAKVEQRGVEERAQRERVGQGTREDDIFASASSLREYTIPALSPISSSRMCHVQE